MSTNYTSYVSQLATLTVISSNTLVNGDNNFGPIIPAVIDYAEGRIYRDLDLPVVRVGSSGWATCTPTLSGVTISPTLSGSPIELLTIDDVAVYTPAGAASSVATNNNLVPVSYPTILQFAPTSTAPGGVPQYFARFNNNIIALAPVPDQAYGMFVYGTYRPAPLSASNSSTWLTQNLPELFNAASMVFMSGHMRDFGAQSDNPQMAQSWESQYQVLLKSAMTDAQRMKFMSNGWSAQIPTPNATPPRV